MNFSDRRNKAVIVFVKAPIRGGVKTRLAKTLGDDAALEIYRCFVADTLAKLAARSYEPRIYFHPAEAKPAVRKWLGAEYALFPQHGRDLGDKMRLALADTFQAGAAKAVLMGTDIPDLPVEIVDQALAALDHSPAVIGPSTDGGYYMIGFTAKGYAPAVFKGITWSTEAVFAQTAERFQSLGIPFHRLPEWPDIDTAEDLGRFMVSCRRHPERAPQTMNYLKSAKIQRR